MDFKQDVTMFDMYKSKFIQFWWLAAKANFGDGDLKLFSFIHCFKQIISKLFLYSDVIYTI